MATKESYQERQKNELEVLKVRNFENYFVIVFKHIFVFIPQF